MSVIGHWATNPSKHFSSALGTSWRPKPEQTAFAKLRQGAKAGLWIVGWLTNCWVFMAGVPASARKRRSSSTFELMQGRLSFFVEPRFKIIIAGVSPLLGAYCFILFCNECFRVREHHRDLPFPLLLDAIVLSHWEMRNLIFLNKYAMMIASGGFLGLKI